MIVDVLIKVKKKLGLFKQAFLDSLQNSIRNYNLSKMPARMRKAGRHAWTEPLSVPCKKKIKPVYFYGNFNLASFKLGGVYMIEALRRLEIPARSGQQIDPLRLRDSIIVCVRENFPDNLPALKANGNKIIIDMRDNFFHDWGALNPDFVGRDIADYLIFPNQALLDKFLSIKPTTSNCVVLYGFADLAISTFFRQNGYKKISQLKCCYFGFKYNLDSGILQFLKNKYGVEAIPLTEFSFDRCFPALRHHNMHIDFRPESNDGLYKPLTKILIAAECRSHILIKDSPRIRELLPSDYPFLVNEKNNAEAAIEKAYHMFGTVEWDFSLGIMDRVREMCSFQNHVTVFVTILEKLSCD
ncbi:MAG: hypothetical protein A3G33_04960 [Omnitrophica bacterium RIFCSPLOWO2_12_FULL_44_17]|uniref:Uncharacterized protein n=1 Tax=Candidatus Danuiimicrobium aquiferis TaxID=1801832 RepID=A0A1G1KXP9_9BACT|nr:MAG: hypothetical protein A3B72_02385 [Omnitrophica bacterium RIFCSPHIGHO2_02_FULL_45_28]OGW97643.1 MAG: hypothetical protein A3G33_04960 [Omnitrophica bacterium RIFCSPLOWO2_12_FULL_44_17]OGX04639.1 MAG: hypothetical protein A3J12_09200 [Omnitrophica bacterium RIFCSPLOWO2_02_FULL_44_11]